MPGFWWLSSEVSLVSSLVGLGFLALVVWVQSRK